jgi:hypothetical protein
MKRIILTAAMAFAMVLCAVPGRRRIASDTPPSYENLLDDIANAPDAAG